MAGLALAAAWSGTRQPPPRYLVELGQVGCDWFGLFGGDVARAWAWGEVALGKTASGIDLLTDALEELAAAGNVQQEAVVLFDLGRLGATGHLHRMQDVAAASDSPLVHAFALHVEGLATGDVDQLAGAGEQFATMGAALFAAEALLAARGSSPFR